MLELKNKNIDQINANFQKFYPAIFNKNLNDINYEEREKIVLGCSLYILAENFVS